jgi:ATP-dependent DNA helicase RecG
MADWKGQWLDDFLINICGLANARGGTLDIGRDNDDEVIGAGIAKEMLKELPNVIRLSLGIVPSLEAQDANGRQCISVGVTASGMPVSYRGRHYIQDGSATRPLIGPELDDFILRRLGRTWDGRPIPSATVSDFDPSAFRIFRERALASGHLRKADMALSDEEFIESLLLTEGGKLTRAAVLLFHPTPEKYASGAYVKVGYYASTELVHEDEFRGSLISVADQIVDKIFATYLRLASGNKGITLEMVDAIPRPALSEAIFNAIVHRDYASVKPIQIKIFPGRVIVVNQGRLPETWTVANLLKKHRSRPYNPKIAHAFYRAGFIETWGSGIDRITEACKAARKREPLFEVPPGEFSVKIYSDTIIGDEIGGSSGDKGGESTGDKIIESSGDKLGESIGENIWDGIGESIGDRVEGKSEKKIGKKKQKKLAKMNRRNIGEGIGDTIGQALEKISELRSGSPTEMAAEIPAEIPSGQASEIPTEMATGQAPESPSEMATEIPAEIPSEQVSESPTEMASEIPS